MTTSKHGSCAHLQDADDLAALRGIVPERVLLPAEERHHRAALVVVDARRRLHHLRPRAEQRSPIAHLGRRTLARSEDLVTRRVGRRSHAPARTLMRRPAEPPCRKALPMPFSRAAIAPVIASRLLFCSVENSTYLQPNTCPTIRGRQPGIYDYTTPSSILGNLPWTASTHLLVTIQEPHESHESHERTPDAHNLSDQLFAAVPPAVDSLCSFSRISVA